MAKNKWSKYYLGLFLLFACEGNQIYQNTHTLAQQTWPATAVQTFTFQVVDTTQAYDIDLCIKNTQAYPYQNFFIAYALQDQAQQLLQNGLEDYMLFEEKTGKPLGTGYGKIKNNQFVLLKNYYFTEPGLYTLNLTQFMRTQNLGGVHAIGIKVNKVQQ